MSSEDYVTLTLRVDTSGFERALAESATAWGKSLSSAAIEFEQAMERVRVLTEGTGADIDAITRQVHDLSHASGRPLWDTIDHVLGVNGPWHWDWRAPADEWPWVSAERRSRMHAAYRAKTRGRNRRR